VVCDLRQFTWRHFRQHYHYGRYWLQHPQRDIHTTPLTFRQWFNMASDRDSTSAARLAGLPVLRRVEQPAVDDFRDQWRSFLIINATRLDGTLAEDGTTTVRSSVQWNLLRTCMVPGSPAQAWFRRNETTIFEHDHYIEEFWRLLREEANRVTPAQITRFHQLAKRPEETLSDFGERFLTSWQAVSSWVAEHQAVTQFLTTIKASPFLLHTVDTLPQERVPADDASNVPSDPRSLESIITLAVNITQQEALRTHASFTPVATPREEPTEAEVMAYLAKHQLSIAPASGNKGKGKSTKAEPPAEAPPKPSGASYYCDKHQWNNSHSTERCYVLHPELRPAGSTSRNAGASEESPAVHTALTNLETRLMEFVNTLTAATNKPPLSQPATHLGATLGDRQPGAIQQQGQEALGAGRCPRCHKLGHNLANCWQEHPELIPPQFKKSGQRPQTPPASYQPYPPHTMLPHPTAAAHTTYLALPAPQQLLALPAPPGHVPATPAYAAPPPVYTYQGAPPTYVYSSAPAERSVSFADQQQHQPAAHFMHAHQHSSGSDPDPPGLVMMMHARDSPQQGERASSRFKRVNQTNMPVSFSQYPAAPAPSPRDPRLSPRGGSGVTPGPRAGSPHAPVATYQNLSLNLAKLAQLGSQFGVQLFEHHVHAPLPEGATSAPYFQALYESYTPGAPNSPGLPAAVVGVSPTQSSPLPGPSSTPQPASMVAEEGGGGRYEDDITHFSALALGGDTGPRPPSPKDPRAYLQDYNSRRATLHFALNSTVEAGVSLVPAGAKTGGILAKTLFDSGANMSVATRQLCERYRIPYAPSPLTVKTVAGSSSGVLGEVTLPLEVVFALGTAYEGRIPLRLVVMEGSSPPVFELLLGTEVLRGMGAYVDPIDELLVYRPRLQSHGDPVPYAVLPVTLTAPAGGGFPR